MFPARNARKLWLGSTILWSGNASWPSVFEMPTTRSYQSAKKAQTIWVSKGLMTELQEVPIMLWQVQDGFSQGCETSFKWLHWKILAPLHSLEQTLAQMSAHTFPRLSCHQLSQPSCGGFSKLAGCSSLPEGALNTQIMLADGMCRHPAKSDLSRQPGSQQPKPPGQPEEREMQDRPRKKKIIQPILLLAWLLNPCTNGFSHFVLEFLFHKIGLIALNMYTLK